MSWGSVELGSVQKTYNADLPAQVKSGFRHRTCKALPMSTKIIPFPTQSRPTNPGVASAQATPSERADALPDWLKALDIEWVFEEDARRQNRRTPGQR